MFGGFKIFSYLCTVKRNNAWGVSPKFREVDGLTTRTSTLTAQRFPRHKLTKLLTSPHQKVAPLGEI